MKTVVIVGGGAAGFFSAIQCASLIKDRSKIKVIQTRNLFFRIYDNNL
jgi:predicted flavoprotein YhiN